MAWQRVLYKKQRYNDNYVHPDFLHHILNPERKASEYEYWQLVRDAMTLVQQISIVFIFFAMFIYILQETVSINGLLGIDLTLFTIGFSVLKMYAPDVKWSVLLQCFMFACTLCILSPVLRTLTASFAEDTIWALAIHIALIHLMFYDYTYCKLGSKRFIGTIALNASMFAAVVLGSRLQSNEHAFGFILFAIEVFAMLPLVHYNLQMEKVHVVGEMLALGIAIAMTYPISVSMSVVLVSSFVFIAFVCPSWFLYVQQYKRPYRGPWDIAHVTSMQ